MTMTVGKDNPTPYLCKQCSSILENSSIGADSLTDLKSMDPESRLSAP